MKLVSDMQEELDRKGLGLYGLFEEDKDIQRSSVAITTDERPFVNISNRCFSCSNDQQKPLLKKAMKMACLSYEPGRIEYLGEKISR